MTAPELHLFSYLACLLWLYSKRRPVADWGYTFFGTTSGAPFSREVDGAAQALVAAEFMIEDGGLYQPTERGLQELGLLEKLGVNRHREPFLAGACASSLALPLGLVRTAISREPELERARALPQTRELLQSEGLASLYEHFVVLEQAFGTKEHDPMVIANVWLSAMAKGDAVKPGVDTTT